MKNTIVCSFATKNTPYVDTFHNVLEPSLKKFNLRYSFTEVPDLGNWNLNTSYKPTFALDMLNEFENDNILLLDVDCQIEGKLNLFDEIPKEYNIGAHVLNHEDWYRNGSKRKELLSGTLWLKNCERTRQICNHWKAACQYSRQWEQVVLSDTLIGLNEGVYELPLSYCFIDSLPNGKTPHIKVDEVKIRHFQHSRKYRHAKH